MESCWSLSTFQGAASARLAMHITSGSRAPAAHHTCSVMYASPLALVAVNVRAPTVDAAMHTVSAECSLSTVTNSAGSSPDSTQADSCSTTGDCGVIGYAAMTWTRASFAAVAAASLPVMTSTDAAATAAK